MLADNGTPLLNASATDASTSFTIELHWPVYTVLPAAVLFFYSSYFVVTPLVLRHLAPKSTRKKYESFDRVQRMCFRANLGSMVHSYTVVCLLIILLATDGEIWEHRMHRHNSALGFSAMSCTLGYFSLSVPWSVRLGLWEQRRDAVPLPMLIHHIMVVCGALVYILGGVCALYGAVGFACMELTNLFFIPRVIAEILNWSVDGALCTVNALLLVATFVFCRVGVCTVLAVVFTIDLSRFESTSSLEWSLVVIAYILFIGVLILSYVWLRTVLGEFSQGVRELMAQRQAISRQRRKIRQAAAMAAANQKATEKLENGLACTKEAEGLAAAPPAERVANGKVTLAPSAEQMRGSADYCPSRGDDQHQMESLGIPAAASKSTSQRKGPPRPARGLEVPSAALHSQKATLEPISSTAHALSPATTATALSTKRPPKGATARVAPEPQSSS